MAEETEKFILARKDKSLLATYGNDGANARASHRVVVPKFGNLPATVRKATRNTECVAESAFYLGAGSSTECSVMITLARDPLPFEHGTFFRLRSTIGVGVRGHRGGGGAVLRSKYCTPC